VDMAARIIKRSIAYMITGLVLFLLIFLLGAILFSQGHKVAGVVLALCAVVAILMVLKGLSESPIRIVMDREGITATEFNGVKIRWDDIKSVKVQRFPRVGRIILFELFDEAAYEMQLTDKHQSGKKLMKQFGATSFCIMAEGLEMPPSRLYEEIINRMNR
jgi:hypothetical protein